MLRESKLIAKNEGPFAVIDQDSEGSVRLRNLVDDSVFRRHHNTLRIFEGTRQEATVLASLDKDEQRSTYWHRAITWAVTWHDHTVTWESYASVEKCQQLTAYALSKPYLRFRFSQSNVLGQNVVFCANNSARCFASCFVLLTPRVIRTVEGYRAASLFV